MRDELCVMRSDVVVSMPDLVSHRASRITLHEERK